MATEASHHEERRSGQYTGPTGRFYRIVDPAHPADYLGWASTREACERYSRSPDVPDKIAIEPAPQLTAYEAGFRDLAKPTEPAPFADWRSMQEYLIENKIPTIHEAD